MTKHSSGILVYRRRGPGVEVFLVHPGGPFWAKKDMAAWSIPKGEFDPQEEQPLRAAVREFHEETGFEIENDPVFLGELKQPGGKIIHAWAVEGDFDPREIQSNLFEMEWPKGSGQRREFPEIDRAGWFDCDTARVKLHKGQMPLIDVMVKKLGIEPSECGSEKYEKG